MIALNLSVKQGHWIMIALNLSVKCMFWGLFLLNWQYWQSQLGKLDYSLVKEDSGNTSCTLLKIDMKNPRLSKKTIQFFKFIQEQTCINIVPLWIMDTLWDTEEFLCNTDTTICQILKNKTRMVTIWQKSYMDTITSICIDAKGYED